VTKPGLMYHFPNRDALMVALVEHEAIQLRRRMTNLLSTSLAMATVADRYRAYIQAAAEGENMRAEWALGSSPHTGLNCKRLGPATLNPGCQCPTERLPGSAPGS
jgi:AcrR family transcriptional regulator